MPYENMPEESWPMMDKCVESVMADGKEKDSAVAICYSRIMESEKSIYHGGNVKALGGGRVAGYLVRFGGPQDADAVGDYFTPATNFGSATTTDTYYQHGLDMKLGQRVIGAGKLSRDDVGVWVEAQLNMRDEYERAIYALAEKGKLGWSSGTAAHLVQRQPMGQAHKITKWPLGLDASLTPTPAEYRNSAMALKQVQVMDLLPERPAQKATGGKPMAEHDVEITSGNLRWKDRAAEEEAAPTEGAEKRISDLARTLKAQDARLQEISDLLRAPAVKAPVVTEVKDRAAEKPFKTFGEQLIAIKNAALGRVDPRLLWLNEQAIKATGASEGLAADGGFLLQSEFTNESLGRVYQTGQIMSRVTRREIGPNSNGLTVNVINETNRGNGNRFGGVRAYWLGEGGTLTKSKPTYRRFSLNLEKLIGLYYATDELLQDATALQGEVNAAFAQELAFAAEDAVINGTGSGMPLGILAADAVVSVSKETGQAAATLVLQNLVKMWSRLWGPDRANAVWLINQDVEPQLHQLALTVGTGGMPVYLPPGGLSASPYASLFGRPIVPVEYCATLGTVGDVILTDLANYRWIEKGGVQAASTIAFKFDTDETTFRWVWRCNGAPFDAAVITPYKGTSNTLAHFVTLATRA